MKRRVFLENLIGLSTASIAFGLPSEATSHLGSLGCNRALESQSRAEPKRPFYETSYRGFVIDLASPDPPICPLDRLDEQQMLTYERMLQLACIDNTLVYCKDHWGNAFYDTKVGKKHGGLKIDFVSKLASILRRNNIAFVAYYSVGLDNHAALAHPDWDALDEDGTRRRVLAEPPPKFYWCCLNSPYRKYLLDQLREIVLGYNPDAVFLDLFGQQLCYCAYCQEKFRTSTGLVEIPKGRDTWRHRKLVGDFVNRTLYLEPLREIVRSIKDLRPDTAVALNGGYAFHRRELLALTDFVVVEPFRVFYRWFPMKEKQWEWYTNELVPTLHDNLLSGVFCRGLGKNPQLVPGFESLVFDPQKPDVTEAAVAQTLASGCRASLYSAAQHVDGSLDKYQFEVLGKVYGEVAKFQDYITDRDSVKSVALLYSENSRQYGPPGSHMTSLSGALVAGAYSLYPFDVLPEWEADQKTLEQFQVLVLPEVNCLSTETAKVLQNYVAEGGNLIATLRTSLQDEQGEPRSDFLLSELLGCHLRRINEQYVSNEWGSYLRRVSEQDRIWRGLAPTELAMAPPLVEVTPDQGHVLAWHLLPATVMTAESWVNWWPPPPQREPSHNPAVIRHEFGKGKVFYCSFDFLGMLDQSFLWPRTFFVNLLEELVPQPPIRTVSSIPGVLAATFFQRRNRQSLIVHLLNLSVWQLKGQVVPICGGQLIVNHTYLRPKRCSEIYPGIEEFPVAHSSGHSVIQMPNVKIHSIFEIES